MTNVPIDDIINVSNEREKNKMKTKWCIEYTIKKSDSVIKFPNGNTFFLPHVFSDYEWYDDETEVNNRVQTLIIREDVIRLTLTKKIVLKG